jgi:hypothetical protein
MSRTEELLKKAEKLEGSLVSLQQKKEDSKKAEQQIISLLTEVSKELQRKDLTKEERIALQNLELSLRVNLGKIRTGDYSSFLSHKITVERVDKKQTTTTSNNDTTTTSTTNKSSSSTSSSTSSNKTTSTSYTSSTYYTPKPQEPLYTPKPQEPLYTPIPKETNQITETKKKQVQLLKQLLR